MTRAKRQWEIEVVDHGPPTIEIPPVSGDGRVIEVIELGDAPGYVVPRSFDASCQDDPDLPCDVTLEVEVTNTGGAQPAAVHLIPRRERPRSTRWPFSHVPAQSWIGYIALPVPQLLQEALAHAAMPASRPMIDEMGYHAETLLETLRVPREPRISSEDRELFLDRYAKVLADDSLETETERLTAVWWELHGHDPERWPDSGSVERLKREADAALKRVGGWSSFTLGREIREGEVEPQPGDFMLPADWPPAVAPDANPSTLAEQGLTKQRLD